MYLQLNFALLMNELLFLIIGSTIFLLDRFIKVKGYAFYLSLVTLFLAILLVFFTPFGQFTKAFSVDFYSSTIKLFLFLGGFLLIFMVFHFLHRFPKVELGEFYSLILFSLLGMCIAISAMDLITLYLGIELLSIPVYFLIASHFPYQRASGEGALKYFIVGCFSSVLLWLAMGLIYYLCGTLNLKEILVVSASLPAKKHLVYAVLILIAGFSVKMALVPFHLWAPDAYEASPIPITAFIAGLIKLAILSALVKVLLISFTSIKTEIRDLLIPVVLLTILVGNLLALKQDHLVRMLAYSSIAQAGYAFLGLVSGEVYGYGFSLYYMVIYLFTVIGIFTVLSYLLRLNSDYLYIPKLAGLSKALPLPGFLILVFFFSLAGVPPTAGFMAKFYLILSLIKGGQVIVALLSLLFSVIGAYPYLRVLKFLYMDQLLLEPKKEPYGFSFYPPALITCFLILILGIFPQVASDFLQKTLFFYLTTLYLNF